MLLLADVYKCNASSICAASYTILTDSVLARFLCTSSFLLISDIQTKHQSVIMSETKSVDQTWMVKCNQFTCLPFKRLNSE